VFKDVDLRKINTLLYKFIWNRKYLAAKAPERIKREIMNKNINQGGFGMLDIEELDISLKLRSVGRLLVTEHPMLKLINTKVNQADFFFPKLDKGIDQFTARGLEILGEDRRKSLKSEDSMRNAKLLSFLKQSKIANWVRPERRNSILLFDLTIRGMRYVRNLDVVSIGRLRPILIDVDVVKAMEVAVTIARTAVLVNEDKRLYPIGKCLKRLENCSSKEIRQSRHDEHQICDFKIGLNLSIAESKTWLNNIRTLTSVKHRNVLLRAAHGDIYSRERCYKFRLADNPLCIECGLIETVKHKLFLCPVKSNLWKEVFKITKVLIPGIDNEADIVKAALCSFTNCNQVALTVHAEIISQILSNRVYREPSEQVRQVIGLLCKKEGKISIKNGLIELTEVEYN
jgi:hypothetical protein